MTARTALQDVEYLVGVLAFGDWLMASLSLAMLIVGGGWYGYTYEGVPPGGPPRVELRIGANATVWIIGGFFGVQALWSIVAADPGASQPGLRRWQILGLCAGILVVVSVFFTTMIGPRAIKYPLWARVAPFLPAVVALRHLFRQFGRRQ